MPSTCRLLPSVRPSVRLFVTFLIRDQRQLGLVLTLVAVLPCSVRRTDGQT